MSVLTKGFGGGGNMKAELLWSNPNPTAAFAPQTIALDLSKYYAVIIEGNTNDFGNTAWGIIFKGREDMGVFTFNSYNRRFSGRKTVISDTGIVFSEGGDGASGNTSNGACIPHYIWGLRMEPLEV